MKTYLAFIESCRAKKPIKGHLHHIHPRAFGGADTPDNIILLSVFDHWYSHYLICKTLLPGSLDHRKMVGALKQCHSQLMKELYE